MSKALEKMLDALTGAYCREDIKNIQKGQLPKTNSGKIYALFAGVLDNAESGIETLRVWDSVENAEGKALDRWGNNYGVKREGADDEFYRLLILFKMIAQLSGGDTDTVIEAAAALFQIECERIELEEVFPAKVRIYIHEDDITEKQWAVIELISKMLKRVVAAGIGFKLFTKEMREIHSRTGVRTGLIVEEQAFIAPQAKDDACRSRYYFGTGVIEACQHLIQPQPQERAEKAALYRGAGIWQEVRFAVGHMNES